LELRRNAKAASKAAGTHAIDALHVNVVMTRTIRRP
jgi:hypothetical protein